MTLIFFADLAMIVAALLCSWVAGFLLAFALVVMPGIAELDDRRFCRAFQVIDGVIQNNQPLFVAMWLGSVLASLAAAALGTLAFDPVGKALVLTATAAYLLGVQLPTAAINVPLNNALQAIDLQEGADDNAVAAARAAFETRWNRSNLARTAIACAVTVLLIVQVAR